MKYLISVGGFATKYLEREYEIDISGDSNADPAEEAKELFLREIFADEYDCEEGIINYIKRIEEY